MPNGERKSANSRARRACAITSGALALALSVTLSGCSSESGNSSSSKSAAVSKSSGSSSPGNTATSSGGAHNAFTLAASGDVLGHAPVLANGKLNAGGKGYDFDPMFSSVKPLISKADLAICHMETPLSPDDTDLSGPGQMAFNVPHEMATSVKKAGFAGCDFANNHMYDRGIKGIGNTKKALDNAGLKAQIPPDHSVDHQEPVMYNANGVKVAQLAYTYTATNAGDPNTNIPSDAPWVSKWMWPVVKADGILADAARAKKEGADVVVISMHWGLEYHTEPTKDQLDLAKKLLSSNDVDLLLGTHAHVVQPCEKINGKYAIYGMGNFLSNQSPTTNPGLRPQTEDGVIVDVKFTPKDGGFTQSMTYQPTHVDIANRHHINVATPNRDADAYKRVVDSMSMLGKSCDAKPAS